MTKSTEIATDTLRTFRDTMRAICPPWLQNGLAQQILYATSIQCDAFGDALVAGVQNRFPGYYNFDSIVLLGRERRLERGLYESDEAYAHRLTMWLVDHRRRGSGLAMLSQLLLHYQPYTFPIDLVYYNGVHFHMDVDGLITRDITSFRADNNAAKWARWWLFYNSDQWGARAAVPTETELQDLRLVPRAWNAAHCLGTIILMPSNGELWDWPLGRTWNESGVWNTSGAVRFIEVDP